MSDWIRACKHCGMPTAGLHYCMGAIVAGVSKGFSEDLDRIMKETPVDETGWLVEMASERTPTYLGEQDDGILGWTTDHMKALRFARKVDGEKYCELEGMNNIRVVEHSWSAGP